MCVAKYDSRSERSRMNRSIMTTSVSNHSHSSICGSEDDDLQLQSSQQNAAIESLH